MATDANDAPLTYSLSGTDADLFSIDADTGEVTFIRSPDYDSPFKNTPDGLSGRESRSIDALTGDSISWGEPTLIRKHDQSELLAFYFFFEIGFFDARNYAVYVIDLSKEELVFVSNSSEAPMILDQDEDYSLLVAFDGPKDARDVQIEHDNPIVFSFQSDGSGRRELTQDYSDRFSDSTGSRPVPAE